MNIKNTYEYLLLYILGIAQLNNNKLITPAYEPREQTVHTEALTVPGHAPSAPHAHKLLGLIKRC